MHLIRPCKLRRGEDEILLIKLDAEFTAKASGAHSQLYFTDTHVLQVHPLLLAIRHHHMQEGRSW